MQGNRERGRGQRLVRVKSRVPADRAFATPAARPRAPAAPRAARALFSPARPLKQLSEQATKSANMCGALTLSSGVQTWDLKVEDTDSLLKHKSLEGTAVKGSC